MVSFPKYESYKDTSISWIQNIPTTWKIERAKWLFRKMERPVRPEDDVVTAFRDGEVTLRKNRREEGFTNAIQEHGYQGIRSGDLVISAMDAFAGAIGVSDSDGKSTPVYSVCIPSGEFYVNNYYYAYLIRYMAKSGFILSLSKGIRERSTDFRFNDFANLYLPIPSKEEQDKIVEFLDRKTAEIDQAIEQKQRLIKLLKEQKAILIDRAVTKGFNSNVPMRDSGVNWIGEIPEHWDISRISFISKVGNGSTPNRSNLTYWSNGSIPWLNSSKVNDIFILFAEQFVTEKAVHECHLPIVEPNSLVIAITGEGKTRGTAAICKIRTTINQHLAYIQIQDKRICPEFLHLYLQGMYEWMRSESSGNGSTKGAITCDDIKKYKVPVPPLEEQRSILSTVYQYTHVLDEAMKKNFEGIEQLNYFKQVLVSDTVTGKLKASNDI
jgi:type I restriction enzyme, S subunit